MFLRAARREHTGTSRTSRKWPRDACRLRICRSSLLAIGSTREAALVKGDMRFHAGAGRRVRTGRRVQWGFVAILSASSCNSRQPADRKRLPNWRIRRNCLLKSVPSRCALTGWGFAGAIATCVIEQEKLYGAALAAEYRRALAKAAVQANLREAQRQWLRYQELTCAFERAEGGREGPSFERLSYARCLLRTTLNRIRELKLYTKSD